MKLAFFLLLTPFLNGSDCQHSTPVGTWKLTRHFSYHDTTYGLTPEESERTLVFNECHNFWIVQASDTVEFGKWKLNRKGTKLTLKYDFSSTKNLRTVFKLYTPLCFEDSITISEDLPGRTYPESYGLRESTYHRTKD